MTSSLFICMPKTNKLKIVLKSRRWKMGTDAAHCARWQCHSDVPPQNPPTPPDELPVRYMPVPPVFWTLVSPPSILLLKLQPSGLQNPEI